MKFAADIIPLMSSEVFLLLCDFQIILGCLSWNLNSDFLHLVIVLSNCTVGLRKFTTFFFSFFSETFPFHKSVFLHTTKRSKIYRQTGREGKGYKEFPTNKEKQFYYCLEISVIVLGICLGPTFLGHYSYLYQLQICDNLAFQSLDFQQLDFQH